MTLARHWETLKRWAAVPAVRRMLFESFGLVMVLAGLWQISPPVALVAGGLAIVVPSVLATTMQRTRRRR